MGFETVLAIETSCDDTSVALVQADGFVLNLVSANQDLAHKPFGGIVPEIASRNHTLQLLPLVELCLQGRSLSSVDGIAVTSRPGLIGSLLVGVVTAKTLALTLKKPFIGVNHLEAHILAPFLKDDDYQKPKGFDFPYVALAVSGGHSHFYKVHELARYEVIGQTVDDAAGEAFDKFAKMLGLGFPGGAKVDQLAKGGDSERFSFPRGLINSKDLNLSFSGLKTSALRLLGSMSPQKIIANQADLCASFQEAVVEVLVKKLDLAQEQSGFKNAAICGGVSANSRLRLQALEWANAKGVNLAIPPLRYCTDNAAMVGLAGVWRMSRGEFSDQSLGPSAGHNPSDFIVRP